MKRNREAITILPARPEDKEFTDWDLRFQNNRNHSVAVSLTDDDLDLLKEAVDQAIEARGRS